MPDLGKTLFNSETLTLPSPSKTLISDSQISHLHTTSNGSELRVLMSEPGSVDVNDAVFGVNSLDDFVNEWKHRQIASGVPENRCFFPFLIGSPKLTECRLCSKYIYPGDEISCSVRSCPGTFHLKCVKVDLRCSVLKNFKCPLHACYICKQKGFWRCARCILASHDKCAAWPEKVIHLTDRPGWAVCWRHPSNWQQQEHADSSITFQDIFSHLPLPYIEEEFKIDSMMKDSPSDKLEPSPYVHIRRNVYLVKKKREGASRDVGCTNCSSTSTCSEDCVCRVQWISCSKACHCSEACTNRPFRKDKRIKIVMTELCGWGVEASEPICKGDFIIEYVGEVIDDVECTQRLWDMKNKNVKNFFMCEIRKDFTIDATFKGNASRFLNHSCDPNCKLEKWQVEGETRVGVFAAQDIKVGEPLTYDYRFVQFGPEVKCHCGAENCQGYLGAKRKINLDVLDSERRIHLSKLCWGIKRKRTPKTWLTIISK